MIQVQEGDYLVDCYANQQNWGPGYMDYTNLYSNMIKKREDQDVGR